MPILAASAAALYCPSEKGRLAYHDQSVASSYASSLDAPSLDEKQGFYDNDQLKNLAKKGEILAQLLGNFLVLSKGWAIFPPQGKKELVFVEKPRITQPEAVEVNAEVIDDALPSVESKPLTAQSLREVLMSFPQTYLLLAEGQDLLIGTKAKEERLVNQCLRQYHQALNSLDTILRQDWSKAFRQERMSASTLTPSFPCFTGLQVDQITAHVNFLSTLSLNITQSGQSLCETPSHKIVKLLHALAVSLGYLAGSTMLFCMGVSLPVITFIAGIASVAGVIGFFAYEQSKESEAKEWKERIHTLANFTKQLENLRDRAMIVSFARQEARTENQDVKLQSQDQKIAELTEQNQQLSEIVFKLQARLDVIEQKETDKTIEGQSALNIEVSKTFNSSISEQDTVIQLC